MKSQIKFIVFILLATGISACGHKEDVANKPEKPADSIEPAKTAPTPELQKPAPANPAKSGKAEPVKTESTASIPAKPQAAQDAIEEVNTYAREKTGTTVSKTRNKAQAAEEEMMRDLGKN
jgi:hypothetical protein